MLISNRIDGILVAIFLGVTLLQCSPPLIAEDPIADRFASREVFQQLVSAGRQSPFGLDYVFVHSPGAGGGSATSLRRSPSLGIDGVPHLYRTICRW